MSGTTEKAHSVLETQLGARQPASVSVRRLVIGLSVSWSGFQLWATWTGSLNPQQLGAIHLAFAMALVFLVYPTKYGPRRSVPLYDWMLAAAGVAASLYVVVNYHVLVVTQGGFPLPLDVWIGTLLLVILALATARAIGVALPIIAGFTILYGAMGPMGIFSVSPPDILYLHNGYSWPQIVEQLYITTEGIWGTPNQVSATFVFLFVLFGALLESAGAGRYFVELAHAALGTFRGGPAKAAVVASLMTGMISGSSTANVVTTGTFTIPLMKRIGYPAVKAGATEVAASVNGQLMPPIMGAAAFIMASFLNIPYSELIVHALIPAVLTYAGLLYVVHLEALKLGLRGEPRDSLPPFWRTFRRGIHYLVPVAFLLFELIWVRLTPERSALNATGILILVIFAQATWRALRDGRGLRAGVIEAGRGVLSGMMIGARNMTAIAVATAAAGIVVGMVTMTNLGYGLTQIIGTISGGNIWVVLALAAAASLILGLGLPTTANYIVMAALVAPVIINMASTIGIAIPVVAIHLFVFYFGILADDTPPVGLAAYAAAAISGADPLRTGFQGFLYDLRTAILPFMFVFNPGLLLIGIDNWIVEIWIILSALVGMLSFVAATQGWLLNQMTWIERAMLLGAAILMIKPGWQTDIAGAAILAGVALAHWWRLARQRANQPRASR